MTKWIFVFALMITAAACSRSHHQILEEPQVAEDEFTEKSADVDAVKVYDDLEMKNAGIMLSSKEIANKICYCGFAVARMNDDVKRYHRNNDKNSLHNVQSRIKPTFEQFDRCMAELKSQYPKAIAENDPNEVMEEVKKQCPKLIDVIEAGHQNLSKKNR